MTPTENPQHEQRDERFSRLLSAVDDDAAPPDPQWLDELRQASADAFAAAAPGARSLFAASWRRIVTSRATKVSAAAAILVAAVVVGILILTGAFGGAAVAWADVVRPILEARSATYTLYIGTEGESPAIRDQIMGPRIRRTLDGTEAVSIIDLETSRVLALDPTDNTATFIALKGLPKMMRNPLANLQQTIRDLQDSPHFVVEHLGRREMDGVTAVGFRASHPRVTVTIWTDVQTRLPVRVEQTEGQMNVIVTDFRFDAELDASLFAMEVPAGYRQVDVELDLYGSTEADFIEGLRLWAELLGDGVFPDDVSVEFFVGQSRYIQEVFEQLEASDEEKMALGMKLQRYLLFIRFFAGEGRWHYAGRDIALGDGETAIFWYRPKGSDLYRVIYGDLSVREMPAADLPEPLPAEDRSDTPPRAGTRFIGRQDDVWRFVDGGRVEALSTLRLVETPVEAATMPIALPYTEATVTDVALDGAALPFEQIADGVYALALPADTPLSIDSTIEVAWQLPAARLQRPDGGYRTDLKPLVPSLRYSLTVVLDDDSGLLHADDPTVRRFRPFSGGARDVRTHFGSCGLLIRPVE